MDDDRVVEFEHELWVGGPEVYEAKVADDCLMALPAEPFLFDGRAAVEAVKATPRWGEATFEDTRFERPEGGADRLRLSREGAARRREGISRAVHQHPAPGRA